jgi:hypothetical protein
MSPEDLAKAAPAIVAAAKNMDSFIHAKILINQQLCH